MAGKKRRLTESEEFEIMKLVLDKFLWVGVGLSVYGLYLVITQAGNTGFYFLGSGVLLMILFTLVIVREFEQLR